jgi:hypothetical protein
MQADGSYLQRQPGGDSANCGSHYRLIEMAEKRQKDSLKRTSKKQKFT